MRYTVNAPFKKMYMIAMPERWFGEPAYGFIRGKAFPVFSDYDEALRSIYGDYMRLPSDIGIAHSIEDINAYLKDKGQDIIDYREKF